MEIYDAMGICFTQIRLYVVTMQIKQVLQDRAEYFATWQNRHIGRINSQVARLTFLRNF